jgi:hypothetical protein
MRADGVQQVGAGEQQIVVGVCDDVADSFNAGPRSWRAVVFDADVTVTMIGVDVIAAAAGTRPR